MKERMRVAALALCPFLSFCATSGVAGTEPQVEFAAYMSVGRHYLFVMYDRPRGESSSWMTMGETWRKCQLRSFDAVRELLTAEVEGESVILRLRASSVRRDVLPRLLRGTATISGNLIRYSPDAQLRVAMDVIVTAYDGAMVYDVEQNAIRGDLLLDDGKDHFVFAQNGTVRIRNGAPELIAKRMEMTRPNKSPEPTPTAVTPRAGETKSK